MERGYAATSLREITAKAQVNLAAVNYHFGSKEALVLEVFQRWLGPLNAARIAYLDRLESASQGKALPVEKIIEAIVMPALQVSQEPLGGSVAFLKLLGLAIWEPDGYVREILPTHYRQVIQRFKDALSRALPGIPDEELAWRMHFMFGALSYAMARNDAFQLIATCKLEDAVNAGSIIRRLVPFLAGGLKAAYSDEKAGVPVSSRKAA